MRHFFDWFSRQALPDAPWLILGKGPTFALRDRFDLSGYHLLSLNHAVREQPVLVAHIIDLDVVASCGDSLESQARYVALPWHPHVENRPTPLSIEDALPRIPVLRRLADADRLLWYDLSTSPTRHGNRPVVRATYFSAEAALNLLALAGARRVRTLGVDGGTEYSGDFDDLRRETLLANGQSNFDLQFEGFARTILETGVDLAPLNVPSPVRVYVAHAPEETLPVAVLRHSVRRRASLTVELIPLPIGAPWPEETGVPALVLSPRVQCLADVRPLWTGERHEREVLVPTPASREGDGSIGLALAGPGVGPEVAQLAGLVRSGASLARLGAALQAPARARLHPTFQPSRNNQSGHTRFVYYAANGSEPWLSRTHPLGHLWVRDLLHATACGAISPELVAAEIRRGHVRPSLGYQVEHRVEEPLLIPRAAWRLDRDFVPPEGESSRRHDPLETSLALLQALVREAKRRARALRARSAARVAARVAAARQ